MSEIYKEATMEDIRVEIIYDRDGVSNPRTNFDNLATMVTSHRRYDFGDKSFDTSKYNGWSEVLKGECGNLKDIIYLPVYLYDHSIQRLSTESFIGRATHAEWDSGQIGWIYVTKKRAREELCVKRITKEVKKRILDTLKAEVELYDLYVSGEVYGVKVVQLDEDGNEETSDSCWGFYGDDLVNSGMAEYIRENIKSDSIYEEIIQELTD
jgi:hypothetical protein